MEIIETDAEYSKTTFAPFVPIWNKEKKLRCTRPVYIALTLGLRRLGRSVTFSSSIEIGFVLLARISQRTLLLAAKRGAILCQTADEGLYEDWPDAHLRV